MHFLFTTQVQVHIRSPYCTFGVKYSKGRRILPLTFSVAMALVLQNLLLSDRNQGRSSAFCPSWSPSSSSYIYFLPPSSTLFSSSPILSASPPATSICDVPWVCIHMTQSPGRMFKANRPMRWSSQRTGGPQPTNSNAQLASALADFSEAELKSSRFPNFKTQ